MLRIDRLQIATDRLAELIASIPSDKLAAELPAGIPVPAFLAAKLIDVVLTMAIDSLRHLPGRASSDPERFDALLQHTIAVVAWLDGQTDELPPALSRASVPAIASLSSGDPEPEKQRFSAS